MAENRSSGAFVHENICGQGDDKFVAHLLCSLKEPEMPVVNYVKCAMTKDDLQKTSFSSTTVVPNLETATAAAAFA